MGTSWARAGPTNLPLALTSLIGRAKDLESTAEALRRGRLVTIAGPGGVGKTRLALEVASRRRGRHRDGVWLVDLTATPERPDVAAEAARALGVVPPPAATATEAMRAYLAERDVLLILDNCEHVIGDCAELAERLLQGCPSLRILATSREPLDVRGETVWRLEPLAAPEAHRLFVERARQHEPRFIPDQATDAAIDAVCSRLDRLPLAIELAAARTPVMSPAELLVHLETHLGSAGAGGRLTAARHRTVRATVEWSYELLEPDDRKAFRALGTFIGGFDARAAEEVGQADVDLVGRLVDKSLVAVVRSAAGVTRYRLLETMREFALELLEASGGLDEARERHRRHFSRRVGPFEARWPSRRAPAIIEELAADYGNVRAAVEWAAAGDPCGARSVLAGAKDVFLLWGATDGRRLSQQLLDECPAEDRERVQLLIMQGSLATVVADMVEGCRVLAEAGPLAAELGEPELQGWAEMFLGLTKTFLGLTAVPGEIELAREHLELARRLHDVLGLRTGWARATAVLGLNHFAGGDSARARELLEKALAVDVAERDDWGQGHCHLYLGVIAQSESAAADAATHFRHAIQHLAPFQGGPLLPAALIGRAGTLIDLDPKRALSIVAAAHAMRDRVAAEFSLFSLVDAEHVRAAAEVAAGDRAAQLWAEGLRLRVEEAAALALGSPRHAHTDATEGVSTRELEVSRLVAAGLTNKQIAARLHLSVRTVESHIRHTLTKTGLVNRTQLATWVRNQAQ